MRKSMQLTGAALALAKDLALVHNTTNNAIAEMDKEYGAKHEQLAKRATETSNELMDQLFDAVGLPRADRPKWAINLRFVDAHDFAALLPLDDEGNVAQQPTAADAVKQ